MLCLTVDEDTSTLRTRTDVLETRCYQFVESNSSELVSRAVLFKPDIIILNLLLSSGEAVRALRFEKGMENVLSLCTNEIYEDPDFEDEPHLRMLIQQTLEELEDDGVELFTAINDEGALEAIREQEPS